MSSLNPFRHYMGARIRMLREQAGLSQRELAKQLGCTQVMLSYLERGMAGSAAIAARALVHLGNEADALTLLEKWGPR